MERNRYRINLTKKERIKIMKIMNPTTTVITTEEISRKSKILITSRSSKMVNMRDTQKIIKKEKSQREENKKRLQRTLENPIIHH